MYMKRGFSKDFCMLTKNDFYKSTKKIQANKKNSSQQKKFKSTKKIQVNKKLTCTSQQKKFKSTKKK